MSIWFSEYRVRCLAERIAPKIAPKVEAALVAAIRAELPALLLEELRNEIPEYVPKMGSTVRRDRNAAIVAEFTGRNVKELSAKWKLSRQAIWNIVRGK